MSKTAIEEAATPEAFIAALRRQADQCEEDAENCQGTWQDPDAGYFWHKAAQALSRIADQLEKWTP